MHQPDTHIDTPLTMAHIIDRLLAVNWGGSHVLDFLQLRRLLGNKGGSIYTGVSPMCFTLPIRSDLVTEQSIKRRHKLGLGNSLVFELSKW